MAWRDTAEMRGTVRQHNIDQTTGRAAVFVAGEPPWHGLGTVIEQAVSSAEAIKLAGLDWAVEQWRLQAWNPNPEWEGEPIDVDERVANVRNDTGAVLGVVGTSYRPLQNAEAFAFMDELRGNGEVKWETAGSLNGGKRVWMLARLPQTVEPVPGDEVKPYALICNGHDGQLAVHLFPTTVRVVCNNTLNLALNQAESKKLTIRHSQSLKGRVEEARRCLGIVSNRVEAFGEQAQALARRQVSDAEVHTLYESLFPTRVRPEAGADGASLVDSVLSSTLERTGLVEQLLDGYYAETERIAKRNGKILEQLLDNYHNERNTLPGMAGTAWGAFNAVSEYTDHQTKHKTADTRLNSAWFGAGDALKQEAFQGALALVR